MQLDVLLLSRVQFALTIMFHYLFPPLSIGLGTLMVFMEGMYLRTGDRCYQAMTKFWTKVFAANFAMGVATGVVMEFQFGTNWANYARYVGDIFGSVLAAEGIFAFFLESGFLAVLVFGWDRVSPRMHFIATLMVALGSIFSAVWIIIANSWQHTPAGFTLQEVDGVPRAVITDFWAMVFNPSSMHRLGHVLLGSFILGAFFVMSIAAYYVLRGRHLDFAQKSFSVALTFGTVSSFAMLISGHFQARTLAHTQPAKLAAMEGHFKTGVAPLHLMGIPDLHEKRVKYAVSIPGGLSFLVHDRFDAPMPGLNEFRAEDQPPVTIPFLTYHLMVSLGAAFVGLTALASYYRWRGTLFDKRWLMMLFVVAAIGPYLANQAGWVATEVGRQPFVVYPRVEQGAAGAFTLTGGLRTKDAMSNSRVVTGERVLGSILLFSVTYLFLFIIWVYVLHGKVRDGPEEEPVPVPAETHAEDLVEAAARLASHSGYSLTLAKQANESTPPDAERRV
jgi:cytochrome bd ubiquinol oxidase subunit I